MHSIRTFTYTQSSTFEKYFFKVNDSVPRFYTQRIFVYKVIGIAHVLKMVFLVI